MEENNNSLTVLTTTTTWQVFEICDKTKTNTWQDWFQFLASQNFVKFGNEKKKVLLHFWCDKQRKLLQRRITSYTNVSFLKATSSFLLKNYIKNPFKDKKRFQWTGIIPSLDRRNFQREIKSILKIGNQKICRLSNLQ